MKNSKSNSTKKATTKKTSSNVVVIMDKKEFIVSAESVKIANETLKNNLKIDKKEQSLNGQIVQLNQNKINMFLERGILFMNLQDKYGKITAKLVNGRTTKAKEYGVILAQIGVKKSTVEPYVKFARVQKRLDSEFLPLLTEFLKNAKSELITQAQMLAFANANLSEEKKKDNAKRDINKALNDLLKMDESFDLSKEEKEKFVKENLGAKLAEKDGENVLKNQLEEIKNKLILDNVDKEELKNITKAVLKGEGEKLTDGGNEDEEINARLIASYNAKNAKDGNGNDGNGNDGKGTETVEINDAKVLDYFETKNLKEMRDLLEKLQGCLLEKFPTSSKAVKTVQTSNAAN